jgi:glycosyltransferase involved in cell wall biosynthesis
MNHIEKIICLDEIYSTTSKLVKIKELDSEFRTFFLPIKQGRKGEGGLRTKGYIKRNFKNYPLISVVTVVFNGQFFLEKTIQSVIRQNYKNIEYIIIDGGSIDRTLDIIKKYDKQIDYWVSEPDNGIYDAMNKGIDLASGQWINFMNAGDCFYANEVINELLLEIDWQDKDFIYGDHEVEYFNKKKKIVKAGSISKIWKGSQFCHQSVFTRLDQHKKYKFDLSYHIGADFKFFYKCYLKNARYHYTNKVIATITNGGVSDRNRIDSIVSWWSVVEKKNKTNLYYIIVILKEMFKKKVKQFIKWS